VTLTARKARIASNYPTNSSLGVVSSGTDPFHRLVPFPFARCWCVRPASPAVRSTSCVQVSCRKVGRSAWGRSFWPLRISQTTTTSACCASPTNTERTDRAGSRAHVFVSFEKFTGSNIQCCAACVFGHDRTSILVQPCLLNAALASVQCDDWL
jgi:hypothetical protein